MAKYIDLSLEVYEGMPVYPMPGYPKPEFKTISMEDHIDEEGHQVAGRNSTIMKMLVHCGTHTNAEHHVFPGKQKVDEIPLEVLIGDAFYIKLDRKAKEAIIREDLEKAAGGKLKKGDRLIIGTGWTSKMWGKDNYYTDCPYLTENAVQWMIEKGISLVAIDFPSEKWGDQWALPNHKKIIGNRITLVEYITNTEKITKERVKLIVAPIKIKGCDGAPSRVIVIEE